MIVYAHSNNITTCAFLSQTVPQELLVKHPAKLKVRTESMPSESIFKNGWSAASEKILIVGGYG